MIKKIYNAETRRKLTEIWLWLLTCGSPETCLSLETDGDGERGRGSELARDDPTL